MDLCGKLRGFADFENTVDRRSVVIFDAHSRLCLLNEIWITKPFFSLDQYVNEFIQITSFFERSSFKLKWWNRELTLKCKFKCYVKPMKDPLGVSPSKGNQGTTRGREKILSISVGVGRVTVDLIWKS